MGGTTRGTEKGSETSLLTMRAFLMADRGSKLDFGQPAGGLPASPPEGWIHVCKDPLQIPRGAEAHMCVSEEFRV